MNTTICCPYCGSTNTHTNEAPGQHVGKTASGDYNFYQALVYVVVCHDCKKHMDVTIPCAKCGSRNFLMTEAHDKNEAEIITIDDVKQNKMDIVCRNCNLEVNK